MGTRHMGEEIDEERREEALSLLNQATEEWKQTGSLNTNLGEPPIPFKKRIKCLLGKFKPNLKFRKKEKPIEDDREELELMIEQLNQVYKN